MRLVSEAASGGMPKVNMSWNAIERSRSLFGTLMPGRIVAVSANGREVTEARGGEDRKQTPSRAYLLTPSAIAPLTLLSVNTPVEVPRPPLFLIEAP